MEENEVKKIVPTEDEMKKARAFVSEWLWDPRAFGQTAATEGMPWNSYCKEDAVRMVAAIMARSRKEYHPEFQFRVFAWMMACFGSTIAGNKPERNHRFLEEALELVQTCGATKHEAHALVDYVYGRPVGDPRQEVGGVMVTLAALCLAQGLNLNEAAEMELSRVWGKIDQIRAKQAAKPKHSPLPEHVKE